MCFDEGSVQLLSEEREPLAMEPGKVEREDYHYGREGVCSIFLACEPLTGKTVVEVKERRTKQDFAQFLRYLIDEVYGSAKKIILIMDNLNTHRLGALYECFPPEEALRLCQKVEIHYTPVHGSWLNMAEIELSVLGKQVLHERMGEIETVRERVVAWKTKRNRQQVKINWCFTAKDARIKLKRLYPVIKEDHQGKKTGH